jgi:dihydrofolate synthase/folylpolyglutamate synthase
MIAGRGRTVDVLVASSASDANDCYNRADMSRWQWALDRLYGFANWETRPPGTPFTFELARIERLLEALGEPQLAWPAVHVGGTNGKGSTCAMTAAVLRATGLRVGLFTSPHVHTVRERIQVDGRPISESAVIEWLERNAGLLDGEPELTTFEALTALACDYFARCKVDIAVIEVGLGGRLDTTRVVRSVVSVLTPIGLDHRKVLGDTLRQIASDKVGIFRPGVPVVSAPQDPEAAQIIEIEAERLGCPLLKVDEALALRPVSVSPEGQTIDLGWRDGPQSASAPADWPDPWRLQLALQGGYQRVNGATAVAALASLARGGWAIAAADVERGLRDVRWPARFEVFPVVAADAASARVDLVIDGAHNPPAIHALVDALDEVFPQAERHLLLGVGLGKELDPMLARLLPGAVRVTTARADHPKALAAATLAGDVARVALEAGQSLEIQDAPHPGHALEQALDRARRAAAAAPAAGGVVLVATGSIFLAGDVREAWARCGGMQMPPRDPPTPQGERGS